MNSARVAVWLLELVTSPERATTTVGDFVEEAAERGRFWFWRQVAGSFSGHVRGEFTSSPLRLLLSPIPTAVIYFLTGIAFGIAEARFVVMFPGINPLPGAMLFAVITYMLLGPTIAYLSGTTIAGPILLSLLLALRTALGFRLGWEVGTASFFISLAFLLPGAIWQRRQRLKRA
jgi:hypothetical protein